MRNQIKPPVSSYPACHSGGAQAMVMQQGEQAVSRNSVVACKKMGEIGMKKETYD